MRPENKLIEETGPLAAQSRQVQRLEASVCGADFLRFLEKEVWPTAPEGQLGRRLSRAEEDEILGYGPEGV